ncbi:MAG: two-component system response regulator [Hydrogenophilales bacterium 28-61-23]|nr:MAG: two-component system response regulator [Hydrogenophilales bacterium 28-61-23]
MTRQISLLDLTTLVVEPSAMQGKMLGAELAKAGIVQVSTVRSGGEALAYLRDKPTSLVVSAFHLSDMTGADLIGAMRADEALAAVPFILVSSENRHQQLDPVRQSGSSGILPKPFSQAQLGAALRAVLDFLNVDDSFDEAGFHLDGLRVMVVDDSPMARKFMRQVLSNLGVKHFLEAENGRKAAELLSDNIVDLVVTDYNMPEMDGQALIRFIRTQSWQKDVPVLMVTSENDQSRLAAVEELGVVGMCDKPFEPNAVRALLGRLLGGN